MLQVLSNTNAPHRSLHSVVNCSMECDRLNAEVEFLKWPHKHSLAIEATHDDNNN